jgi:hypothetical protein
MAAAIGIFTWFSSVWNVATLRMGKRFLSTPKALLKVPYAWEHDLDVA